MNRGRSSILFSATFLPIQYYKSLLGGIGEDYEVYAKSVFRPDKKALLIASDVTSKYSRRSESEYFKIARYIQEIVKNRHGNYMVFCPSHSFLRAVYGIYEEHFSDKATECIIQQEYMDEQEREDFLKRFEWNEECNLQENIQIDIETEEDHSLIGFCVLGGIFSEGIDLKNDCLIGAVIVGTGIPQVCEEREIIKDYFDRGGENGFNYSYRYPGMNKVLQASGRVIRTDEDIGVVALLDERFLQYAYKAMFPREWEEFDVVTVETVAKKVERFWDSWL
jgi:Rad3-related DNA helicase